MHGMTACFFCGEIYGGCYDVEILQIYDIIINTIIREGINMAVRNYSLAVARV